MSTHKTKSMGRTTKRKAPNEVDRASGEASYRKRKASADPERLAGMGHVVRQSIMAASGVPAVAAS